MEFNRSVTLTLELLMIRSFLAALALFLFSTLCFAQLWSPDDNYKEYAFPTYSPLETSYGFSGPVLTDYEDKTPLILNEYSLGCPRDSWALVDREFMLVVELEESCVIRVEETSSRGTDRHIARLKGELYSHQIVWDTEGYYHLSERTKSLIAVH
jgi:hypothetical protein